jgi:hypothetical protein
MRPPAEYAKKPIAQIMMRTTAIRYKRFPILIVLGVIDVDLYPIAMLKKLRARICAMIFS